jgi:type IV pilus assembly protein PilQ
MFHMKIPHTLSALVLAASAVLAQAPKQVEPPVAPPRTQPETPPAPPAPVEIAPPVVTPPTPGTPAVPAAPGVPVPGAPAAIDPPVQNPGAAPGVAPGVAVPPVAEVPIVQADPTARGVSEFAGDPIDVVLRTLARKAKMNVVVSPAVATAVTGGVSLRLEDKTPREVIEIICQSYGLAITELGGVFYIKTQAEQQKEPTEAYQYTFSYATADKAAPLLQSQLASNLAPQFDVRTNTIFYREGKSNADKIKLFLESIDQPTQQVMIEARLVEVTANPKQSYGINWGGVVGSAQTPQSIKYGGSTLGSSTIVNGVVTPQTLPGTTQNPNGSFQLNDFVRNSAGALAGQFAILSLPQMSATLRFLNEDSDAEFLANPRVVTSNNQKAEIKITRSQPVPKLNFNEQTAQAVFGGFEDKEFGNTLKVTPIINKDSFVSLQVQPEISNKVGDATFVFGGASVASPIIDKRTFDSNVLIKSGDTLAIGGLLQDESTKNRAKVPIFGNIPGIGKLFQEHVNSRTKRNLLVFVTPTIIKQGYGTGLESQVSGLTHSGEEYADPNGWRDNASQKYRIIPKSNRQNVADYPKPGIAPAPKKVGSRSGNAR